MLNIKGRTNGKALAFGRRGTYNPATGKMGLDALVFQQASLVSGCCPEARHSKAGCEGQAVQM
jgi:hypothetical protein